MNEQKQSFERLAHIDLLESISIFFVILYHGNNFAKLYAINILQDDSVVTYLQYFGRTILSICVPMFFFVHGYLLFNKEFNLKKHLGRIGRLFFIIAIWSIILLPINTIIAGEQLNIKTLIFSILNLDDFYFWFLEALLCLYILFPVLKASYDYNKNSFVFFVVACAVLSFGFVLGNQLLSLIGTVIHHPLGNLDYQLFNGFNMFNTHYGYSFVYFCVGGLIVSYENKILSIPRMKRNVVSVIGLAVSCTLLFLVGVYYTNNNGELWDAVWNGYDTVFTFANVIFIYVLSLSFSKNNAFIKSISCNTLGIYLIHPLIIRSTGKWVNAQPVFCNYPSCFIFAIGVLCVSLLICIGLRKIPFLKNLI